MIPLPEGISNEDVGQWLFGGIFLARRPDGELEPATGEHFDNPVDQTLLCRFMSANFRGLANPVALKDVYANWPLLGSVNLPDMQLAVHVDRRPAKHYRRTFVPKHMIVTMPRQWEATHKHGSEAVRRAIAPSSMELLRAVYRPEYPSFEEAQFRLNQGWLSVALNPRVILAGDAVGKRMLYYRGDLAATLSGNEATPLTDVMTARLLDKATDRRYAWPQ